jgi:hypothetical protein
MDIRPIRSKRDYEADPVEANAIAANGYADIEVS